MRLTEFWQRMEASSAGPTRDSVAADYRLTGLGSTVDEAIAAGVETKDGLAGGVRRVRRAAARCAAAGGRRRRRVAAHAADVEQVFG